MRYIGNHSSGRMGFAIAEAFAEAGADVTVVSGPASYRLSYTGLRVVDVVTAEEMFLETTKLAPDMDVVVFAAAVADFTPLKKESQKIRRAGDEMVLHLKPTRDIAGECGKSKRSNQLFVGFALETTTGIESALEKLERKNLDLIVYNTLADKGAGFGTETNKVTMIDRSGNIDKFELKSKKEVAIDIVEKIKGLQHDT